MTVDTKLGLHTISSKTALSFISEINILSNKNSYKPEVAQTGFCGHFVKSQDWTGTKLQVPCLAEKIIMQGWRSHLLRMERNIVPKLAFL